MLEGIPGGMSSAQLLHGCINALAPMIHHAMTIVLVTGGRDRLDIMSSICEVSLSIHGRLVKKGAGKASSSCVIPGSREAMTRELMKCSVAFPAEENS